jgi:hypothetical protein
MVISPFPEFVSFSVKTRDTLGDFTLSPEEATVLEIITELAFDQPFVICKSYL